MSHKEHRSPSGLNLAEYDKEPLKGGIGYVPRPYTEGEVSRFLHPHSRLRVLHLMGEYGIGKTTFLDAVEPALRPYPQYVVIRLDLTGKWKDNDTYWTQIVTQLNEAGYTRPDSNVQARLHAVREANKMPLALLDNLIDTDSVRKVVVALRGSGARIISTGMHADFWEEKKRVKRVGIPPFSSDQIKQQLSNLHSDLTQIDSDLVTRLSGGNPHAVTQLARLYRVPVYQDDLSQLARAYWELSQESLLGILTEVERMNFVMAALYDRIPAHFTFDEIKFITQKRILRGGVGHYSIPPHIRDRVLTTLELGFPQELAGLHAKAAAYFNNQLSQQPENVTLQQSYDHHLKEQQRLTLPAHPS